MSHGEQGPPEIDPHERAQERFRQAQLLASVHGLVYEDGQFVMGGSERLFDPADYPANEAKTDPSLEEQGQERLFE